MQLRYGMNPHQRPASVNAPHLRTLHGQPSYINLLDILTAWQLVRSARAVLGRPAAASFKHVSPAGAAVSGPIDEVMAAAHRVESVGPLASAYIRARDADAKSSYGDVVAVSEPVDIELAEVLRRVASDAIIAPEYSPDALKVLARKKNGSYLVLQIDPDYEPPAEETREVFGAILKQRRDDDPIDRSTLTDDLVLGLITLRYTQSNSVAYVRDGMTLGIGAGQQSRVDCTRLAGDKVDTWWLRRHPLVREQLADAKVRRQDRANREIAYVAGIPADNRAAWMRRLDDVSFVSDGAIPFVDNIHEAARHGVRHIAEPGGSIRSDDVAAACQQHGISLVQTGLRLFCH